MTRVASTRCDGQRSQRVIKDGRADLRAVPGSEFEMKADLVLLAMGFLGPEKSRLLTDLGVKLTDRGTCGATSSG